MMRRVGGVLLTVTGILFCPCHFIITLPLLAWSSSSPLSISSWHGYWDSGSCFAHHVRRARWRLPVPPVCLWNLENYHGSAPKRRKI